MSNDVDNLIAQVVVDLHVKTPLDYLIPDKLHGKLFKGARVKVPLRTKECFGTVVSLKKKSVYKNLKEIMEMVLEHSVLDDDLLQLADWMKRYYLCSDYQVFKTIVPTSIRKNVKPKLSIFLTLVKSKEKTLQALNEIREKFPKQAKILKILLKEKKGMFLQDLLKASLAATSGPVDSLIKKKWIASHKINPDFLQEQEYFFTKEKKLTIEQQVCFDKIHRDIQQKHFCTHLIYGVTGSGKTEIYLRCIQQCLDNRQSALLLLPEIALTTQMIERFRSRFAQKMAILHHKRSLGERYDAIDKILKKECLLIVGARSAVFAPAKDLGVIIVDEEHEASYKQSEEPPFYNARDIAVMRGKLANCPVILGSATPSIESYYNATEEKYTLSTLTKRATSCCLPQISIVDMKKEYKQNGGFSHFSSLLLEKMKQRFENGEQTILFLNRRGYYASYICEGCANVLKCSHCDLALTFHKSLHVLRCHLCGFQKPFVKKCAYCSSSLLQYKGFGTEHVEKSLYGLFPEMRVLRMDKDTTSKKHSHDTLMKQFRSGKADVLIGTQMVAKGLHFPCVTLVGVLNADANLFLPDFRASEQTFQILTQVAGRAGREEIKGEVIFQTMNPDNPLIQMAKTQDYVHFYQGEIESRKSFYFPPFCHLWKLVFNGKEEKLTLDNAMAIYTYLKNCADKDYLVRVPTPCGYAKIKDKYRFQIIIHGKKVFPMNHLIEKTSKRFPKIGFSVDVDPISTFF